MAIASIRSWKRFSPSQRHLLHYVWPSPVKSQSFISVYLCNELVVTSDNVAPMSSDLNPAGPADLAKLKSLQRYALSQTKLIEPLSSQKSRFQDFDDVIHSWMKFSKGRLYIYIYPRTAKSQDDMYNVCSTNSKIPHI